MRNRLIKRLKELGVVRMEKVKLKNDGASDFYIDIKKAYGDQEAMRLMSQIIGEKLDKNITCIAAGGYGGLPLATAVAVKNNLKLTLIREKPKTHGRNVWIDGYIPTKKDSVAVVDDVFTTGGSLRQIIKVLGKIKVKIKGCSVVIKRANRKVGFSLDYILESRDLL